MASKAYDRHLTRLRRTLTAQRARTAETIATCFPAGTSVNVANGSAGSVSSSSSNCPKRTSS
jgi:DNA-binding transcriptional MocR family regulator